MSEAEAQYDAIETIDALSQENTRLRSALERIAGERVCDCKDADECPYLIAERALTPSPRDGK